MSAAGSERIALDGHTLGTGAGGNESYVAGLLEGLADARFAGEVMLYTRDLYTRDRARPGAGCRASGSLRVVERPLRAANAVLRLAMEIPAALRRDRPQVAHFQYVGPLRSPCPVTIAVHDTSFLLAPELLPRSMAVRLRAMTGWAIERAAVVVVPSAWTAETLATRYPHAVDKLCVVPLSARASFTPLDAGPAPGSLPPRFCLYVGRRQRRKNIDFLLRAYAAAAVADRTVPPLVLIGPPSAADAKLRDLAAELIIADRVVWAGYATATALAHAYRSADFLCFPCRYEGFGLPVAEALACGCPVLAADEGGVPETLGGAGRLLPVGATGAWADAIVELSGDETARRELARSGLERGRGMSWARTANGWLDAARAAGCL